MLVRLARDQLLKGDFILFEHENERLEICLRLYRCQYFTKKANPNKSRLSNESITFENEIRPLKRTLFIVVDNISQVFQFDFGLPAHWLYTVSQTHIHTWKWIRRFAVFYAYCRFFIRLFYGIKWRSPACSGCGRYFILVDMTRKDRYLIVQRHYFRTFIFLKLIPLVNYGLLGVINSSVLCNINHVIVLTKPALNKLRREKNFWLMQKQMLRWAAR